MKRIEKWVADDGTEFGTREEALKHERFCNDVSAIFRSLLVNRAYVLGHEETDESSYVQQDPSRVLHAKRRLVDAMNRHTGSSVAYNTSTEALVRIAQEGGPDCLFKAFWRLCCIDEDGREWLTPFHALCPPVEKVCRASWSEEHVGHDEAGRD